MLTDAPTVSRMRVSVDETGVKYLLSKCSDQFICSLKDKYLRVSNSISTVILHSEYHVLC